MFIEVTSKNSGNRYIFPRLSAYVYTENYTPNTIEVIVGTIGSDLKVSVKETYEEIRELLGLIRTPKEVTNGN